MAALLIGSRSADAQWTFTKIADFGTTVPGTGVQFRSFGLPSIDNGLVGFTGYTGAPVVTAGVYTGSGGPLTTVANHMTPIPGGTGTFTGFAAVEGFSPSLSAGQQAFVGDGFGTSVIQRGVYVRAGPTLARVVDRNIAVPNGSGGNFFVIGQPSLQSGRVVFMGREFGVAQRGVYSWQGGSLSVVADRSTPVPSSTGTFTDFFDCDLDEDHVVLSAEGQNGHRGLYRADPGGSLTRLYDSNTVVPGGNGGAFTFLSRVSHEGDDVAFWALGGEQEGFYTDAGGTLNFVVHDGTPAPSVPGAVFTGYGDISLDSGIVAFQANLSNGNIGVYSTHTGSVQKVVNFGDIVDGKFVQMAFMGPQSLDGNSIAVELVFSGTPVTEGIYIATIDLPCYPDCNADGALTVADFGCFQSRFILQLPYADCNHDAVLTVADFGCFQTKFVTGCP